MSEDDLHRAMDLIKSGKKIEAREILERVVQADPQNDTAWIWLADTYPDNPNRSAVLQECLKHNPNSHVAQKWLESYKFENSLVSAIDLLKNGKKVEAREILERIVQDDPQNDTAWIWLADTYPDNPNRYAVLQECLKHNPNSHVAQKWLESYKFENSLESAIDLLKNGKKVEAREILERIVQNDPQNDTAWIWLAYTYPDILNRIAVLQECLKHNPNSHVAQKWLASFKFENSLDSAIDLLKNEKEVEAREILERIVQDDPQNDTAWIWLAYTYPDNLGRIAVLQECLKYNPNSHIAQKWLATARTKEAMLPGPTKQDLPDSKSNQNEQDQENVGNSAGYREYFNGIKSKLKIKNPRLVITLASILGIVLLGTITIFGVRMLQKQRTFPGINKRDPTASPPTVTQVPSSTIALSVVPIIKTPTFTHIPTMTLTPSVTSTPLPVPSFAPAPFTPMPEVAQQAREVAVSLGFKPQNDACGQNQSCQAYLNQEPYMLIVVMNDGLVTITFDEQTLSGQNSVQTPATGIPNGTKLLWYEYVIGDIYNSFSSDFGKDAAVVLDRTMKYGSYDWVSFYGYKINGTQSIDHKIILTIAPP